MGRIAPRLLNLAARVILTQISLLMMSMIKIVSSWVSRFFCEVGVGSEMRGWGLGEGEEGLK